MDFHQLLGYETLYLHFKVQLWIYGLAIHLELQYYFSI